MTTYNNGPGNIPKLPERVVDTLIHSAGVSRLDYDNQDQSAQVERLVHDTCEEMLARLQPACADATQRAASPATASCDELNGGMHASIFVKVWGDAGGGDAGRIALANYAYDLGRLAAVSAATKPAPQAQPDGPCSNCHCNDGEDCPAYEPATKPAPLDLGKLRELAELWAGKYHSAFQADRVKSSAAWTELEMYVQSLLATKPAEPVIPAPRVEDDEKRISAAARTLADRSADSCNVNRDDNWNTYSSEFIEDARLALAAADAVALPIARQAQPTDRDEVLEVAAQACEREAVTVETWRPYSGEQEARNGGVEDCAAAIRALKGKSGSKGDAK